MDDKLIAAWSYNPFTEWTTIVSNKKYLRPKDINIPIIIHILFIGNIILCGYISIFKDVEKGESIEALYPYIYVNYFLVVLNCFYIIGFPILYLIEKGYYFPFLTLRDIKRNVRYYYLIGPGYILQLISFLCILPYVIYYQQIIERFRKDKDASISKNHIEKYITETKDLIDFDKLIAEEQVKYKVKGYEPKDSFLSCNSPNIKGRRS